MVLVVETGAGLSNANSYVSFEFAEDYFAGLGYSDWTAGTAPDREAALRRATQYIDMVYGPRWPGQRTRGRDQALDWPRKNVITTSGAYLAHDVVPIELMEATAEAARRELATPFSLMPDEPARIEKRVAVGPISVEYADSRKPPSTMPVIDALLAELLRWSSDRVQWLQRA